MYLFIACCVLAAGVFVTRKESPKTMKHEIRDRPLRWSRWDGGAANDQEMCELMSPPASLNSVSQALHYLYFHGTNLTVHGVGSDADNRPVLSSLLEGTLVNNQEPLFYRGADGFLRSADSNDQGGEKHPGQTLAYLGKSGVSASQRVDLKNETVDVRDIVNSSLATFTNSGEIEWWILAFLHYLPPNHSWKNRWGTEFSFDSLANQLLLRELGEGPCNGTHALEVMVALVNVNAQYNVVTANTEQRLRSRLLDAASLLRQNQCPDGGWDRIWYRPPTTGIYASLHATGHHLEWILDAPETLRPPQQSIEFAVKACRQRLRTTTILEVNSDICTYTHAIKSVVLFDSISE